MTTVATIFAEVERMRRMVGRNHLRSTAGSRIRVKPRTNRPTKRRPFA